MTSTQTTTPGRSSRSKRSSSLPPTLGPVVCRWIEQHLVHSHGDAYGRPFRLLPFQRAFIYRAYELLPDGRRKYRRVIWGLPTGNGKTELAAALACAELAGPVVCAGWRDGKLVAVPRTAPDIPVAAASFEQADLLFSACRAMIREGPLADQFEVYDTEILPKHGGGRLYRVAAKAGTNDGKRPTFVLADELHEWECTCGMPGGKHVGACKARVYVVLSKGRAKRHDAWELLISTAGYDLNSLLGRMYLEGKRGSDPQTYFEWWEGPEVNLADDEALVAALKACNPALGHFLSLQNVLSDRSQMTETEFRRYHLNQWVHAPERWLPTGAWDSLVGGGPPPEGTEIVIGFDGSYSGDSTAIVGATIAAAPHIFVIAAWEQEPTDPSWRVDILDVEESIRRACARWVVRTIGCDPFRWQRSIAILRDEGLPVIEWPSHQASHMVPACAQFRDAVLGKRLTHDGDSRLARHIGNAVVKIDSRGPRIVKMHKDSVHRIDLAVAAVIAYDLATRANGEETTGWVPI